MWTLIVIVFLKGQLVIDHVDGFKNSWMCMEASNKILALNTRANFPWRECFCVDKEGE